MRKIITVLLKIYWVCVSDLDTSNHVIYVEVYTN